MDVFLLSLYSGDVPFFERMYRVHSFPPCTNQFQYSYFILIFWMIFKVRVNVYCAIEQGNPKLICVILLSLAMTATY